MFAVRPDHGIPGYLGAVKHHAAAAGNAYEHGTRIHAPL